MTERHPPKKDVDGRWWQWKPKTGYMLETRAQTHQRENFLKSVREGRSKTRAAIRIQLYELGEGKCLLCHQPMKIEKLTLDHVIPKSKRGREAGNFLPAHSGCNRKKRDREPTGCELIWLEVINARARAKGLRWGS